MSLTMKCNVFKSLKIFLDMNRKKNWPIITKQTNKKKIKGEKEIRKRADIFTRVFGNLARLRHL